MKTLLKTVGFQLPVLVLVLAMLPSHSSAQINLGDYTLVRDYNFGTASGNTVKNLTDLGVNFNPYGVAGTSVINSEWQRYQPFNSTNHAFTSNDLELTAVPNMGGVNNGGISSGQITSKETFYPSNGKTYLFQIRAKIPNGVGSWPAFWMYSPGGAGSTSSEIDIFEFFNSPTQNTYDWTGFDHGDGVGSNYYNIMTNQWVWHPGFDFSNDYHTYTLIWKEGDIQKWVDNTMVKGTNFNWFGQAPQVLINLAVGGSPNSPPDASTFPCRFQVDYFRVYEQTSSSNKALNKTAVSSSNQSGFTAAGAFDGNTTSRWSSSFSDPQWVYVDLGANYSINQIVLLWEAAYGKAYQLQTSTNAMDWTTIYSTTTGNGNVDDLTVTGTGRYVRMYGTTRGTGYGYSLYEFEVYGSAINSGAAVIPGTIQSENFSAMSGVQMENTTDTGGGQNVGWLDDNDWMDYYVNATSAGTYSVSFRVSGWSNTAQLQIRSGSSVLATVPVPSTGGFQTWTTTAPVTITLPSGPQTLRVFVMSRGFNLNWMNFSTTASRSAAMRIAGAEEVNAEEPGEEIKVYPNPTTNAVRILLNNDYRGPVRLSMLNATGQAVKAQEKIKTMQQFETEIDISDFAKGMYVIKIIADKRYTEKVIKQY